MRCSRSTIRKLWSSPSDSSKRIAYAWLAGSGKTAGIFQRPAGISARRPSYHPRRNGTLASGYYPGIPGPPASSTQKELRIPRPHPGKARKMTCRLSVFQLSQKMPEHWTQRRSSPSGWRGDHFLRISASIHTSSPSHTRWWFSGGSGGMLRYLPGLLLLQVLGFRTIRKLLGTVRFSRSLHYLDTIIWISEFSNLFLAFEFLLHSVENYRSYIY